MIQAIRKFWDDLPWEHIRIMNEAGEGTLGYAMHNMGRA